MDIIIEILVKIDGKPQKFDESEIEKVIGCAVEKQGEFQAWVTKTII
jgi:hypothetical protein